MGANLCQIIAPKWHNYKCGRKKLQIIGVNQDIGRETCLRARFGVPKPSGKLLESARLPLGRMRGTVMHSLHCTKWRSPLPDPYSARIGPPPAVRRTRFHQAFLISKFLLAAQQNCMLPFADDAE